MPGTVRQSNPEEQWAVMVDVTRPVPDFHKRVPEMAHQVRTDRWKGGEGGEEGVGGEEGEK